MGRTAQGGGRSGPVGSRPTVNGRFQRRRFLGLMGAGGLVAGGAVAGHVATALPSEASEALAREDTRLRPHRRGDPAGGVVGRHRRAGGGPHLRRRAQRRLHAPGARHAGGRRRAGHLLRGRRAGRAGAGPGASPAGRGPRARQPHVGPREPGACSPRSRPGTRSSAAPRRSRASPGQPPRWYRPPRGMVTGSAVHRAHQLGQGAGDVERRPRPGRRHRRRGHRPSPGRPAPTRRGLRPPRRRRRGQRPPADRVAGRC